MGRLVDLRLRLIACRLQRCRATEQFPLHFGKETFPRWRGETSATRGADWAGVNRCSVIGVMSVKREGRAGGFGGERTAAGEAKLDL